MPHVLVLHGVNLNMLGRRDPTQYGTVTLDEINSRLEALAHELGVGLTTFQTNHEGVMVERIHQALDEDICGVLINAGAWSHYSLAIMDALDMLPVPVLEVHLSHIHTREEFRRHSVLARVCVGSVAGLGVESYAAGLRAVTGLQKKH